MMPCYSWAVLVLVSAPTRASAAAMEESLARITGIILWNVAYVPLSTWLIKIFRFFATINYQKPILPQTLLQKGK